MLIAADALREARLRAGLSQSRLGALAGILQSVVSAYERGRREPSVAAFAHLVRSAGFEPELVLVGREASAAPFTGPVGMRVQRLREAARRLLLARGFTAPRVFGSVARGDDEPDSDVDVLVDVPAGTGLFALARMALDLESLLGVRVDLIPRDGLSTAAAADARRDAVPL